MRSGSARPVTVSKKMQHPVSLPFSERQIATSRPSVEGTDQSIEVVPFVFQALGSNTTLRSAGGEMEFSRTSTGCCAGG